MYRLKEDHMEELEIKKSRFLCYLHKTFSEEDAKEYILKIKKNTQMPDTTAMLLSLENIMKSKEAMMMVNQVEQLVYLCWSV